MTPTKNTRLSSSVLRNLTLTRDTRSPFRVGALSGSGNGQLDLDTVTYCRDIQHALNTVKFMRKDRPAQTWVIRPKHGATNFKNTDIDALVNHCLMVASGD